ncbi:MAG: gliding motility protein GldC [Chitinophagaceae bacterium]
MTKSNINIELELDDDKIPCDIRWRASDSTINAMQKAKAVMISFWDGADKTALRIDLWTKGMMVDEMADFFYQTITTMADSYKRATGQEALADDMKNFAKEFYKKFSQTQVKENAV